jgi:hypothetical protein
MRRGLEQAGVVGRNRLRVVRASADAEERLRDALVARLEPPPSPGPARLAVIVDWGGDPPTLEALLLRLQATPFASAPVSVVGAAVAGGLGAQSPGQEVATGTDRTAGTRRAVEGADAELILFLRDTIEPLEVGWLARLVNALQRRGAAAAGPQVLYGSATGPRRGVRSEAPDLTVAHRGFGIALQNGLPVLEPLAAGSPASRALESTADFVEALSRDCLLVRSSALMAVGGPTDGDLAFEPVELCARLRAAGHTLVCVPDAVVWDRRPLPRPRLGALAAPGNRSAVAYPEAFRAAMRDRLSAKPDRVVGDRVAVRALRFAIVGSDGSDLAVGQALRAGLGELGLSADLSSATTDGPVAREVDVIVAISPTVRREALETGALTVAWVRADLDGWLDDPRFDDFDLVLADTTALKVDLEKRRAKRVVAIERREGESAGAAEALVSAIRAWLEAPRVAIHIGPATRTAGSHWGDTPFARGVQKAFERRGWVATVHPYDARDDAAAIRADVAIHVLGGRIPEIRSGQIPLLWIISHPDRVTARLCEQYERVFVASDLFCGQLVTRVRTPVVALHQATDPEHFFPEPGGPPHELLFVGNSRNARRPVIDALAGTTRELAVYGTGWTPQLVEPRHVRGDWIPNEQLRRYYAAAAITLNDHWRDMRDEGFISNRIYDVLASGGFVISDEVPGLAAEFDGAVPTWATPDGLAPLIDHYLADPEERREHSNRGRAAVLARHTFDHRVATMLAEIEPVLSTKGRLHAPEQPADLRG